MYITPYDLAIAVNESVNMETINEAAIAELCSQILDEAYYGRKIAQPILDAMVNCCKLIDENPTIAMNRTDENIALQKAVQKVFGFKSCTIRWENRGMLKMGAYTYPGNPTKYGSKPAFKYGQHKDGFYDTNHDLPVFIECSNNLYLEAHLTPEEMTAILIHEIGHNFDFTPATMFIGWTKALLAIIKLINDNYIQKGLKRKDLINPEYIYIGISSIEINDKFACYITLSNRK